MVVLLDLNDHAEPPELSFNKPETPIQYWFHPAQANGVARTHTLKSPQENLKERANPNKNSVTEALGCYPIISEIASLIDLNTLDNLSRTCRQTRENLLQFRKQLISSTLHCSNDDNGEHTLRYRARAADWYFVEGAASTVGKVGPCARDMVSECRRCGRVICRNCNIKSLGPIHLRHRRLCPTCIRTPLTSLISPHLASLISTTAIHRAICTCSSEGAWFCQPCGRGLSSADTTYESIWRWRTSYGPALGGLGTGIGDGNRSFECGRAEDCLAARLVEEEVDCDAEDVRQSDASRANDASIVVDVQNGNSAAVIEGIPDIGMRQAWIANGEPPLEAGSGQLGPGYARHEIEGIGGVVKKKLVRIVWVGACVTEWEDEKEQGRYLVREMEGRTRSWCGWCRRFISGAKD